MTCTSPPELDDLQLAMALDGDADEETIRHLERCPSCRARARLLAQIQGRLSAYLYRATCPDPEEFRDSIFGLLDSESENTLVHHVAVCPHCAREFTELRRSLAHVEPVPSPGLVERIRVLVAQLMQGGGLSTPALAAVRGEDKANVLYQVDDIEIGFEVEDDPAMPGQKTLLGLVIGAETMDWRVHVWQDDQLAAMAQLGEAGDFAVDGLAAGVYEVIFTGPAIKIYVPKLMIDNS